MLSHHIAEGRQAAALCGLAFIQASPLPAGVWPQPPCSGRAPYSCKGHSSYSSICFTSFGGSYTAATTQPESLLLAPPLKATSDNVLNIPHLSSIPLHCYLDLLPNAPWIFPEASPALRQSSNLTFTAIINPHL